MKLSFSVGRLLGIDVRVHVTFALILLLGALTFRGHGAAGAAFGAGLMALVFACVFLHELGHSLVARKLGLNVREIVLLPIGGVATISGTPRRHWHEVLIAAAGPAVNVVLAVVLGALLWLTGSVETLLAAGLPVQPSPSRHTLLLGLFSANVALALFNLLPVFPLDGGRILRALLAMRVGQRRATEWAANLGQLGAVALGIWAIATGQVFLAVIAVFIFLAAARERHQARVQPWLDRLRARDLAELPAFELERGSRVGEALLLLLRTSQRTFPVVDGEGVVGLVSREALVRAAREPNGAWFSVMTLAQPPTTVAAEERADAVLAMLVERELTAAVVMEGDQPLGLITIPEGFERAALWALEVHPHEPERPQSSVAAPRATGAEDAPRRGT